MAKAHRRHSIKEFIIVCPKTLIDNWSHHIKETLNIKSNIYTKFKSLEKARKLNKHKIDNNPHINILIVSYGSLWSNRKAIRKYKFEFMIFDESHKIKNRKSKQAKAAFYISKFAEYILLLTGTPMGKDEIDLYSQIRVMSEAILGNWKQFRRNYCRKSGYMGTVWKIRKTAKERYLNKISKHSFVLTQKQAWGKLPEVDEEEYFFSLTGKAAKHYNELETEFYTEYEGTPITTDLAISNIIKLQRLSGGFLAMDGDDGKIVMLEQDKLILLLDILDGINKKVVIFCKFLDEINIISKSLTKLKYKHIILQGETKDRSIWRRFQSEKNITHMICQISTGGVGIDLFAGIYGIFYSNVYNYIDFEQAKMRLIIKDKEDRTTFIHLLAENTVDIDIRNSLKKKQQKAKSVINNLKRRLKCQLHQKQKSKLLLNQKLKLKTKNQKLQKLRKKKKHLKK